MSDKDISLKDATFEELVIALYSDFDDDCAGYFMSPKIGIRHNKWAKVQTITVKTCKDKKLIEQELILTYAEFEDLRKYLNFITEENNKNGIYY